MTIRARGRITTGDREMISAKNILTGSVAGAVLTVPVAITVTVLSTLSEAVAPASV